MSLTRYNSKRNFKKTSEPSGKKATTRGGLKFVIQQHAASHLHYDFRLEMDGVLKSWAVPKGPSMNPADKRLAMMVEDHPYNYRNFEGSIPEGNYGAGNVIVWDNGIYNSTEKLTKKEEEKKLLAGLHKGHISFVLHGKKLKGEFSLVKLNGKQENAWLLFKKEDKYSNEKDILLKDKSVLSGKKLIIPKKNAAAKKTRSKEPAKKTLTVNTRKKKLPSPDDVDPMLAEIGTAPFDDPQWLFETKYDGYRALAIINSQDVQLFSRNHISFNNKFAAVADELSKIHHSVILDGEVVIEDKKGNSHFQSLQNFQRTGTGELKYYVFDILNLDGTDVRELPLIERKELLKLLLQKAKLKNVFYSEHVIGKGKSFYKTAEKKKLEGIIAKDSRSPYRSGRRSGDWLKIKLSQQEEAIITGITSPRGSRNHFGSILLGMYKGDELIYIGNCGTGFSDNLLKELYTKFKKYFIARSPFSEKINLNNVQWMKPALVCQVKFTEWTQDGHLRHPVFLGLRIDKNADEVQLSQPKKMSTTKKQTSSRKKIINGNAKTEDDKTGIKAGNIIVPLTNQQKIYFPKDKITKGDIVNYYNEVSDLILPYLKNRPQSLNRFPNGINGPSFYQKDIDVDKVPSWIKTEKIYSASNKEYIDYLICNDKATLLYMANLGCIEINPWNSQLKSIENPDWMVIDLDPEKIAFKEVVRAAIEVRRIMEELNVESYCKTSGATGLHIYIPMQGKYNYDVIKTFAQLIAQTVNVRLPETTSIVRSPQKRQGKVYIDFLQNRRGQTLAAPYSVRPKPGATVSTPLEWKEVNNKLDPTDFTIKTIFKRLDKKGDLWKKVIGKGANLDQIMKKMTQLKS